MEAQREKIRQARSAMFFAYCCAATSRFAHTRDIWWVPGNTMFRKESVTSARSGFRGQQLSEFFFFQGEVSAKGSLEAMLWPE